MYIHHFFLQQRDLCQLESLFFMDIHIKKLYRHIISPEDEQKCNSNYQEEKPSQPSGLSVCTHPHCDMLLMESDWAK